MSSDIYFYDTTASLYHHSSPEMVSSDGDFLIYDPFSSSYFNDSSSSFNDSSSADIFQEISNNNNIQNPVQNSISLASSILSCSPPSHQLENLSLYQTNSSHVGKGYDNGSNFGNGYANLDILGVKTEESQMGFDSSSYSSYNNNNNNQIFLAPPHHHSYNSEEAENVAAKWMQRSYSSNSFEGKPDYLFQPRFDSLLESPNCQNSPENSFLAGQLRRVCSTGDLQNIRSSSSNSNQTSFSSLLGNESSFLEEGNFKVGRYSAEERKDRISKYRAKRNQRNFTKTIKYACRKTLADNRPRIRGRFARNDETCEIPKAACSTRHEDADELWFGGLNGEEEEGGIRRGGFINNYGSYGQAQLQYYSY